MPKGCIPKYYPETKNGATIKWFCGESAIFEWNEDLRNGAHYHITPNNSHTGIGAIHYEPLSPIPEPYATIFFR